MNLLRRASGTWIVLFLFQAVGAATVPGKYTLTVHTGKSGTGMVYLSSLSGEEEKRDSARIVKGRAVFSGTLNGPRLCVLHLNSRNSEGLLFFLEKGKTTVSGSKDAWSHATVSGSVHTAALKEWEAEWDRITAPTSAAYKRAFDAARLNNGIVPDSLQKEADRQHDLIGPLRETAMKAFLQKYPSSPASAYVVHLRYIAYPAEEELVRSHWAELAEEARQSFFGQKIAGYLEVRDKTAIGVCLSFAQSDTAGKMVRAEDFRGRYLLVDFWASWCGPCRKENPNVVTAYRKYHEKGFDILGISLDNKKDAWIKAIRQDGLEWAHVSDLQGWKNSIAADLGISMVPTNLLLDPEGRIIARDLRGEELQEKLAALFK